MKCYEELGKPKSFRARYALTSKLDVIDYNKGTQQTPQKVES